MRQLILVTGQNPITSNVNCYKINILAVLYWRQVSLHAKQNTFRIYIHASVRPHSLSIEQKMHSPGCTDVTPSPTLSTYPPPSCPNTQGNRPSGSLPPRVYASVWQTPEASSLILTSPFLGGSTSTVSMLSGLLASHATAALHWMTCRIAETRIRGRTGRARNMRKRAQCKVNAWVQIIAGICNEMHAGSWLCGASFKNCGRPRPRRSSGVRDVKHLR